ncbi:50S ribosomal protein L2 [Candidatus Giovannonibacteria bacterium RIFCSPHIGHO2_02_FULL_46_20]|uniref:Large ribosomal subunit protein uL2 n=1 Tax=Candidatus Giovannonibacteria bacterium RIFCSPHIGHO2_02_FULL_46_20 TaxID=1798338 RepID=A0A1F5WFW2_9BACT|nr:MAG: 50S ribosomal protein L2 [Candidatus Giovannonibacteria bacterium RIFCSPHIGHO2_02_FULL_46_20]
MKSYASYTPSRRHMSGIDYRSLLTRQEPHKALVSGRKRAVGRNNQGRITTRHKGGGQKRLLRAVDFYFDKRDIPAIIESVEYDPYRTAFIGLVRYRDGERRYMVLPGGVAPGREIIVSYNAPLLPGNRLPLAKIPVGTLVYNVSPSSDSKAMFVRSAGSFAEILAHDAGYVTLKMPSSEVRKISDRGFASIGQVSNEEHNLIVIGKAGRSRWMGIRPTVRGSAMNPVDHPYGGGEGRTMRGTRRPKNKWGKGTRGVKTRNKKKWSSIFIISRRITKKRKQK